MAAVKDADQILVLDGGRVAERGTHGELLRAGGLYASLYRTELDAEALARGGGRVSERARTTSGAAAAGRERAPQRPGR